MSSKPTPSGGLLFHIKKYVASAAAKLMELVREINSVTREQR